ncbi:MAG: MSMEG_4193 family putative phosphomutase [Chloroflexi bacterium]|nr:MSMEG_4193 family putative phosphomutase [Chloroflexota bacterium]
MTRILLVRHAVNDFVKTGRLAGWTPGVHLNAEGLAQAAAAGKRLEDVSLTAIYASPLERTVETAEAILQYHPKLNLQLEEKIGELRYGKWEGGELRKLNQKRRWYTVQHFPSRMQFPHGETIRAAQARAVDVMELLVERHENGTVAVVSHSDIIKLILAYYLGMHLDMYQRLNISPASISVLILGENRPMVDVINDTSHLPKTEEHPQPIPASEPTTRYI